MYIFDLKLGYNCNNDCVHCIIDIHKRILKNKGLSYNLTTEECKQQIDIGLKQSISAVGEKKVITLTGGEPTIRNDFFEICDYAIEQGFDSFGLQTNGRRLADPEFTHQIKERNLNGIVIALHAPHAELHDRITGRKGSFSETVQGIKNLGQPKSFMICGKIVLSQYNYKEIINTMKLFEKLNVKEIFIAFPHSGPSDTRFFDFVPRYSEIAYYINEGIQYAKKKYLYVGLETIPFCFASGYEEYINEEEIGLTEFKKYVRPVFTDIFEWKKKRLEIKNKSKKCNCCYLDKLCEGVWEEYLQFYGDDEFTPITDMGKFATIMSKLSVKEKLKNNV